MTEHQLIEGKESWKDDYLKWISGFANAQGGTLVKPANPDIANAFFRAGATESWGRGIELIRNACRTQGTLEPVLRWEAGLWVEFPFNPRVQLLTTEVTPEVTQQVTQQVVRLLACMQGTMDRSAVQAALGLKDRESFRSRYLQPAFEAKLIAMTQPDKPNSAKQQYRLTDAGIALRDSLRSKDNRP